MVGELGGVGLCMCRGMVVGKVGDVDGIMVCCGHCGSLGMVGVVDGGMVLVVSNVVVVVGGDIWWVVVVGVVCVLGALVGGVCNCVDLVVPFLQILLKFLVLYVFALFPATVYFRSSAHFHVGS
jgi:hypothetical protein